MNAAQLLHRHYPESRFGGFSRDSAGMAFYVRLNALLRPGDRVLDFGAGRGEQIEADPSPFARGLKTFRGRVAHVEGCDVDAAVLDNPYVDSAKVFDPAGPLPYPDASFDLIHAQWVFEHVADPVATAAELMRVLKPGGHLCAMTPNKYGYVALASRVAGSARHVRLLRRVQPEREARDVFPTWYRLNTPGAIRRHFGGAGEHGGEVAVYGMSSEPAYHFNNPVLFRLFKWAHALTPPGLETALLVFVRKHGSEQ